MIPAPSLREVSEPEISPDGAWVAYVVRTTEVDDDRMSSDIWKFKQDVEGYLTHLRDHIYVFDLAGEKAEGGWWRRASIAHRVR